MMGFKNPEVVSVGEAAEITRISPKQVRALCKYKKLKALKNIKGLHWCIFTDKFENLIGWKKYLDNIKDIQASKLVLDML